MRTILITGATDGLGRALAADLASTGATLLLHGRDDARGKDTGRKTKGIELGKDLRPFQQTNDHTFPIQCGHGRNPEIHVFAGKSDFDSTVLGQTTLGDIELGQNLKPRNHGGLQLARRFVESGEEHLSRLRRKPVA